MSSIQTETDLLWILLAWETRVNYALDLVNYISVYFEGFQFLNTRLERRAILLFKKKLPPNTMHNKEYTFYEF